MPTLWKTLVLALVLYTIYLHRKLLYLTDAAYQLAHEARFSNIETTGTSLHDTVWGGEIITMMNMVMAIIIVLAVVTFGRDAIGFLRQQAGPLPQVEPAPAAASEEEEAEKPTPPPEPPPA